jgi:hypothetical protein
MHVRVIGVSCLRVIGVSCVRVIGVSCVRVIGVSCVRVIGVTSVWWKAKTVTKGKCSADSATYLTSTQLVRRSRSGGGGGGDGGGGGGGLRHRLHGGDRPFEREEVVVLPRVPQEEQHTGR